ncbi:MAG: hypothetical protein J7M05_09705 [Anaerolineae bacterium]|nr:hypothetical protein [Anaerolineae bacterium]
MNDERNPEGISLPTELVERQALFAGLIYNERGEPAQVAYVGGVAHYAIPDDGFLRHVEAYKIDREIIAHLKEQISSMQDEVVQAMMQALGKNDLLTKAAIDASIRNLEWSIRQSDPDQWLPWLKLFGFRVIVDVHGNVVRIIYPSPPPDYGD